MSAPPESTCDSATVRLAGAGKRPRNIHEYRGVVLSEHGPPSGIGRCVAVTLAQFMDSKTLETIVGIPRIATSSGFCERAVRTELRVLSAGGWITEQTRGRGHPVTRAASFPANFAGVTTRAPHAVPPRHEMPEVTPVNGTGNPGIRLPDTPAQRAAYLDQNLEKNLGAASPAPANAVSAALSEQERFVIGLSAKGYAPVEIAKFGRVQHGLTLERVNAILRR